MIIPAIDLLNGEAVRLLRGDYASKTVYSRDPAGLAKTFERMGAKYLHIVDLDGAKRGEAVNAEVISKIRESVSIPMQAGGGIRNAESAAMYLEGMGINRIILGTAAANDSNFVRDMIKKYGAERIVAGVDVRNGTAATNGWLEDSGADYLEFIGRLKHIGVRNIVVTDISKDGALTSPNWDMYERISGVNVMVSGGVSCQDDIEKASKYYGVIVGKAYYEGKVVLTMTEKRIIACLDTVNGRAVKGVNFIDLAYIGDTVEMAKRYEEQGADEIALLDITATNEQRESMYALLERAASELSVPITLGGGIRSVDDFRKALACGASKVSINSAAVANPELINAVSSEFGRQRVVIAIDGKKAEDGYHVYIKGGREDTGLSVTEWAKKCEALGAGEILLTSIDRDGARNGYDIEMTRAVCRAVGIPVIASGGCGKIDDIIDVFKQTGCDAALVASLFHYGKATVNDVKSAMERNDIPCRISKG